MSDIFKLPINKEFLKNEAQEILNFFKNFVRHPVVQMKNIPDWPWPKVFIIQIALTALIGALSGVVERSFYGLFNFFLMPVLTLIIASIWTLFFYYMFQLFLNMNVSFRKLYTIVLLANFPYLIFQVLSTLVPPLTLVGLGFSAMLLIVGFKENFEIPRKFAVRVVVSVYAVLAIIWGVDRLERMSELDFNRNPTFIPEVKLGE